MKKMFLAMAAFASSTAQAQSPPCFWVGRLFTCNQQPQAQGNGDIFVAQGVTGPASAFPANITPDDVRNYNAGVRDSMVNKNLEHLTPDALSVSTEVVSFGSHKVLKSRLFAPSQMFMYQFAGVSGGDTVVVGCISRTARPFETRGTECERQAAKAFGN